MQARNSKKAHQAYILAPEEILEDIREIKEQLAELKSTLEGEDQGSKASLEDYVDEKKVQQLLGKKSTSLWKLRREGILGFSNVDKEVYYKLEDINDLLAQNSKDRFA